MCEVEVKFEMDLGVPDQTILDYAKENLNELPDTKALGLLRKQILENGDNFVRRRDDNFLLKFLRARDFDIEKSYQLLINYYKFKECHPEYYDNIIFERLLAIGDASIIGTLPFFEESGRRILILRMGKWIPEEVTLIELFQAILLSIEMGLLEQKTQILGGLAIVDVGGIKLKHLYHMSPKIASQLADIAIRCYPMKIHAVHFVNQNILFSAGYKILQPFLSDDLKQKMFFHGNNYKSLHKHISPKFLPKVFGGVHPDYGYEAWFSYIEKNEVVLNELRELGYNLEEQVRQKRKSAES